ncbi:lytic transglycosylase domain-containing protein [Piscinibacter sp. HJYY11]|uniref:lytic transglycosylase domain-containing protein n=1 Tax=Piscinibacter sp. HJYY11 TaxID=2801333 RepID=UPI00191ED631|nr:lytic transglycosylase domain-containing protein [Piscinibacter sp. HJYY11]
MMVAGLGLALMGPAGPAFAQTGNDAIVAARDAFGKRDTVKLAQMRGAAMMERHPLAMWVDYWQLNSRLYAASLDEVEAFYRRWSGTYVEDRLRNDWLLELGRRREWKALAADYPRFRMNDDREVTCYALLADHLDGKDVRSAGRAAWFAQREGDDGCNLLATSLYEAKQLKDDDVWRRARLSVDANKPRAVRQAATLISAKAGDDAGALLDRPERFLAQANPRNRTERELATLALMRLAANDPDAAASSLRGKWENLLPAELGAWAWAAVAKQAAIKLLPDASDHYQRAALMAGKAAVEIDWADETLAWKARAALRANNGKPRWQQVVQAINAMAPAEQRDPTWVYWKARALKAIAPDSSDPQAISAQAQEMLGSIAGQLSFYGALAAEELGRPITLPEPPAPLTDAERQAAAREPGLQRALQLIAIGLRNEGVREWNFTLRGMDDRALIAAAQLACDKEVWDRCINTSDRTRGEIHLAQRYPTPFKREVQARAKEIGLDAAYVYGLIRQESRFIMDARSHVGASGLMQIMPATARWTARKIGLPFSQDMIADRDTNLKLGTQYLRLVLEDFEGSELLAAAAYNAGPSRPRRWREGPVLEAAIWAENVPFNETRDYVKKVLSNAIFYSALLNAPAPAPSGASAPQPAQAPSLKARLGRMVGPRLASAPTSNGELP